MDVINIINIWRREERAKSIIQQSKEYNVPIMFWEGIEKQGETTAKNINAAHREIVQWAKDNKLSYVIIGEDDLVLSNKGAWEYYLKALKDTNDWDLYLSMVYSAEIKDNRIVNGFSGLTLYAVSERFYDTFLSIPEHVHIDRHLGTMAHEKKYLLVKPYCSLQSGGFSDNLKMNMEYSSFTDKMSFYGRENQLFRGGWINK